MIILRYGDVGPNVELLQACLNRAGLNVGAPDGIFGPKTKAAVQSFQKSHGLDSDGIFGPITYGAMKQYFYGYFTYSLNGGENLASLANKFSISEQALQFANPHLNFKKINYGDIINVPLPFQVTFTDISFSSVVLSYVIEGLLVRYPFIKVRTIGHSELGEPLLCLSIGEGENEVFYNASHHANEWITTPVLCKFLEEYADSYIHAQKINGHESQAIFEKTTIYIVPMVNPDGVNLVVGEIKPNSLAYSKAQYLNNNAAGFPKNWKANINGVDLNLNYPAYWKNARETKFALGIDSPGPRDYVGASPLSEVETQAVAIFTLQHHFRLTLSYHSQGKVIFWKFLHFNPPQSWEIAKEFSAVSGYAVEETPLQSGYAGYKDWFIMTYNLPGYTIEVGLGNNPLPITQFSEIYSDNKGILVLGAIL